MERALVSALDLLLGHQHDGIRSKIAKDYFGKEGKDKREARQKVESCGITDEQIAAAAMVIRRGEEILVLDRMVTNRANISRHLRKAIDRRAETDGITTKQRGDQGLGAQGLAN